MLFLKAYEEIERETKKVAQRIFRKYYMEEKKNQEILREKEKS